MENFGKIGGNWENLGKLGKLRKLQMTYLIHNLVIHEWGCFLGGGSCQAATYPHVGVHPRPLKCISL